MLDFLAHTLGDTLAHWLGFLGPYRVTLRAPLGDEWISYTMGVFTEAQGLRWLHESGYSGTLTKRGAMVALKN